MLSIQTIHPEQHAAVGARLSASDTEEQTSGTGGAMACKVRRRGLIFAALFCFLLPGPVAIAYVRIFSVVKSGQHARIEATIDAKPLPGASVEVYRGFGRHGEFPKSKALFILTTDQHGVVDLPALPNGKYLILARSKPNLEDWLYLDLSSNRLGEQ